MNKYIKPVFLILLSCLVLVFATTILLFYIKFSNLLISNDIAEWGQAGDYFGGILNPVISLMSLLVLAYITLRISQIEHERARQNIAPLPDIIIDDYESILRIDLRNQGIGPMVVKKIVFKDLNTEDEYIFNFLPKMPPQIIRTWWNVKYNLIIPSQTSKTLLALRPMDTGILAPGENILESYKTWFELRPKVRDILKDVTIEIIYVDNIDLKKEIILIKTLEVFKN